MMPPLKDWLKRGEKRPKQKKRIRPMSKKRERENREYLKKRKAFLKAHPYCQARAKISDFMYSECEAAWMDSLFNQGSWYSTEIHHMKKPKCKYLNDETTWLAVSRWSHNWIEDHKDVARGLGLLAP